jgi:hypothetical protein
MGTNQNTGSWEGVYSPINRELIATPKITITELSEYMLKTPIINHQE